MDRSDIKHLIDTEIALISKLLEIKSAIEHYHKKTNIIKTTSTSVSAAGTVSTIAGVCLAPTTGGLSLALTAGGIGMGIAGGSVGIGTEIASHFKYKKYAKELEKLLKDRLQAYYEIGTKIEKVLGLLDNVNYSGSFNNNATATSVSYNAKQNEIKVNTPSTQQLPATNSPAPAAIKLASKVHNKPQKSELCLSGFKAIHNSYDNAHKIYDTSQILKFLYLNREIYSITNLSAALLAQNQLSGLVIGTIRNSLNKGLIKLGAKIGLDGLKVGAKTMLVGLGILGIVWDSYSLVKTWSTKPEMWKEIQQLIEATQMKIDELELFLFKEQEQLPNNSAIEYNCT